jgi:hypothetical protein
VRFPGLQLRLQRQRLALQLLQVVVHLLRRLLAAGLCAGRGKQKGGSERAAATSHLLLLARDRRNTSEKCQGRICKMHPSMVLKERTCTVAAHFWRSP